MSDEITSAILRRIRDDMHKLETELRELKTEVRGNQDEIRTELSIVHAVLRDSAGRLLTLTRIVKNRIEPAIADLFRRMVAVEKKVGI